MSTKNHYDSGDRARDLAAEERRIAGLMDMGVLRWGLAGTIAVFLFSLVLPFASGVSGIEVLLYTENSRAAGVKITENLFVWIGTLGLGIFGLLTVITRRSTPFIAAWALTTIALIESLLALWLRQTSQGYASGGGIYLAILAVIVAEVVFVMLAVRRNPEQEEIARKRQLVDDTDAVGHLQQRASMQATRQPEHRGGIVDDRRARAAQRHRRLESNGDDV